MEGFLDKTPNPEERSNVVCDTNFLADALKTTIKYAEDKRKIEIDKTYWQYLNLLLPIIIMAFLIGMLNILRVRKYFLLKK